MRRARRAGAAAPRGNPAGASVFCMAPLDPASAESDACIRANHAAWLAARGTRSTTHEFKHRSRQEILSDFRIVRNERVLRRNVARACEPYCFSLAQNILYTAGIEISSDVWKVGPQLGPLTRRPEETRW